MIILFVIFVFKFRFAFYVTSVTMSNNGIRYWIICPLFIWNHSSFFFFFFYILSDVSWAIPTIYSESIKTFLLESCWSCVQQAKNLILRSKWLKDSTKPLSLLFDNIAVFEISFVFLIKYENNYYKLQNHYLKNYD